MFMTRPHTAGIRAPIFAQTSALSLAAALNRSATGHRHSRNAPREMLKKQKRYAADNAQGKVLLTFAA